VVCKKFLDCNYALTGYRMLNDMLFVANWKMQFSYIRSMTYINEHRDKLCILARSHSIAICPSFDSLANIGTLLNGTNVFLGAQDVSPHASGAYTGQVSASSLKEVGCTYCIIGHSERRQDNCETDEQVAQKITQLSTKNIIPIICIGETKAHYQQGMTTSILQKQLVPVIDMIKITPIDIICIAYEPVWAIGTNDVPSNDEIAQILKWIHQHLDQAAPATKKRLLYGGSVSPDNAHNLASAENLDGFLIGSASTDFKKFEKIVSLEDV